MGATFPEVRVLDWLDDEGRRAIAAAAERCSTGEVVLVTRRGEAPPAVDVVAFETLPDHLRREMLAREMGPRPFPERLLVTCDEARPDYWTFHPIVADGSARA